MAFDPERPDKPDRRIRLSAGEYAFLVLVIILAASIAGGLAWWLVTGDVTALSPCVAGDDCEGH